MKTHVQPGPRERPLPIIDASPSVGACGGRCKSEDGDCTRHNFVQLHDDTRTLRNGLNIGQVVPAPAAIYACGAQWPRDRLTLSTCKKARLIRGVSAPRVLPTPADLETVPI